MEIGESRVGVFLHLSGHLPLTITEFPPVDTICGPKPPTLAPPPTFKLFTNSVLLRFSPTFP